MKIVRLQLILILPFHITDTQRDLTRTNSFKVEVTFLIIVTYSETAQNGVSILIHINFLPESLAVEHPASC